VCDPERARIGGGSTRRFQVFRLSAFKMCITSFPVAPE
jgi:hypothetical protein